MIARQLALFREEQAELIRDCDEAEDAYNLAGRDEAEERYGEYVDLVESGTELLADLRDAYAATLDEDAADAYTEAFNRAVQKELPRFGLEVENR